jgi:hypothetical protein
MCTVSATDHACRTLVLLVAFCTLLLACARAQSGFEVSNCEASCWPTYHSQSACIYCYMRNEDRITAGNIK